MGGGLLCFIEFWWFRVDITGEQGVGVKYTMLQQVSNHMPAKKEKNHLILRLSVVNHDTQD